MSAAERGRLLYKLADLIETEHRGAGRARIARQRQAAQRLPWPPTCRWRSTATATTPAGPTRSRARRFPIDGPFFCYTRHEPVGVVGQIIPWNFPLLMQAWKWGPALATRLHGRPEARRADAADRAARRRAGSGSRLPRRRRQHRPRLRRDRRRRDRRAHGRRQGRLHRRAPKSASSSCRPPRRRNLKRVTLELGGKSPNIVFADADLDAAVEGAHFAPLLQPGPVLLRRLRLFVEEKVHDEFVEKMLKKVEDDARSATRSTPTRRKGPQVSQEQFDNVMGYIDAGKKAGAKLLTGGNRVGNAGLLHRADRLRRREGRHEDRPGRDLRPGDEHHPVQGRRRSHPARQPHASTAWPPPSGRATSARPTAWPPS